MTAAAGLVADLEQLFYCQTSQCRVVSCRACNKPDHRTLTCKQAASEEIDSDKKAAFKELTDVRPAQRAGGLTRAGHECCRHAQVLGLQSALRQARRCVFASRVCGTDLVRLSGRHGQRRHTSGSADDR